MGKGARFHCDIMDVHDEVTGSCHLVIVKFPNDEVLRFVVDCGLFQGEKKKEEEKHKKDRNYKKLPFELENINFTLVTHVHVDHVGRLPFMVKSGYKNPIYATRTTCNFLPLALFDSHKVLSSNAKRANIRELYSETDVEKTLKMLKPCEYNETQDIHKNVKITFFSNGHLLGASMILVQISYPEYEDINLLFTGDYNNKNMFFEVQELPEWVKKLRLTIIQESTYGDMDSCEIEPCFEQHMVEAVKNSWTSIVPVFSLGRSQEILYKIRTMQEEGKIPISIPIYLDGKLAIRYTKMYINGIEEIKQEMRDFLPSNFTYVDKELRKTLLTSKDCKIILTTSGMGSYGPAQIYIPTYISRHNAMIHFTGYTPPDTIGGELKNTQEGEAVEIGGVMKKKFARVEYTKEFSAHAKADEMITFLKQFNDLKLVLINHGEIQTKNVFARRVLEEVNTKEVGILGEYFFRVDSYGLVKTMTTKFL